jgi:histidyl-tRNA synthetase
MEEIKKVVPSVLPGFMELLPNEQVLYNQVENTIRCTYERFGFLPLDTPVLEKSEVLLAKAGGETEKQIYRFSRGDTDMTMRFDLTVPLARFVAQNYNELSFPFRRYQIGKVYRGERNQKARYREFYQCDIDIIGDGSLEIITDAEVPSIIYNIFTELGFNDFKICINNRKLLSGFLESISAQKFAKIIFNIIDRLKKNGKETTIEKLLESGIEKATVDKIVKFITMTGNTDELLKELEKIDKSEGLFRTGLSELKQVVDGIRLFGVPDKNFMIDLSIMRGLDYYTGTVYETFIDGYENIGSVCSGGRYDNLAEYYTEKKLPGVGISIGLTRLFSQLSAVIKPRRNTITQVIMVTVDVDTVLCLPIATQLRNAGINVEIYFEKGNIKSKMKYADKLKIPYIILLGSAEVQSGKVTLKNMATREQSENIDISKAIEIIKEN